MILWQRSSTGPGRRPPGGGRLAPGVTRRRPPGPGAGGNGTGKIDAEKQARLSLSAALKLGHTDKIPTGSGLH
jgi:hypothetical protein